MFLGSVTGFDNNARLAESGARRTALGVACGRAYVQVMTSRLMEQLSEPAVLLALQMYFPDMLLVRLLSRRVPDLSSVEQAHSQTHSLYVDVVTEKKGAGVTGRESKWELATARPLKHTQRKWIHV